MGQSKLNLSEEVRSAERKRFNALKGFKKPIPATYLMPGASNLGRNKFKKTGLKRKKAAKLNISFDTATKDSCTVSDTEGNIYNLNEVKTNE